MRLLSKNPRYKPRPSNSKACTVCTVSWCHSNPPTDKPKHKGKWLCDPFLAPREYSFLSKTHKSPVSQSRITPGITTKSADSRLRIPVFFNNWYLFPHLSLMAFLLISTFPQHCWQHLYSHHQKYSSVSWDAVCEAHKLYNHLPELTALS